MKNRCNFSINGKNRDLLIEEYIQNKLSEDERDKFEEHLFECDICFDEVYFLENIKTAIKGIIDERGKEFFFRLSKQFLTLSKIPLAERMIENSLLEKMVANSRSKNFEIVFNSPIQNTTIKKQNDVISLKFKGYIKGNKANFIIKIYSNQPDDYKKDISLYEFHLPLDSGNKFNLDIEMILPNGLYYYILEKDNDDDPLYIGKFIVKE